MNVQRRASWNIFYTFLFYPIYKCKNAAGHLVRLTTTVHHTSEDLCLWMGKVQDQCLCRLSCQHVVLGTKREQKTEQQKCSELAEGRDRKTLPAPMSLLVTLRVYGVSEQCKRGEQNNNKQDVFAGVHSFQLLQSTK